METKIIRWDKMKKLPRFLKERVQERFYGIVYRVNQKKLSGYEVASIEDTLIKIAQEHCSIGRFGDGELKWMSDIEHKSFQKNDSNLRRRLCEVADSSQKDFLIGMTPAIKNLDYCTRESRKYWMYTLGKYGKKWIEILPVKRYYNANISRFYISSGEKELAPERFGLLKQIWRGRKVLVVEGRYSKLGVGNDFLEDAADIHRILAPEENAFSSYDRILEAVKKESRNTELVLLALGPTATVLAYDLAKLGIWAVDIGHADIEYEWWLRGCVKKEAIPGKAVNEAGKKKSAGTISKEDEKRYRSQVIKDLTAQENPGGGYGTSAFPWMTP